MEYNLTLKEDVAEIRTDVKWIITGVRDMHKRQDVTNGRINALENMSDNFVTKEYCHNKQENRLEKKFSAKDKLKYFFLGLIGTIATSTIILVLKTFVF